MYLPEQIVLRSLGPRVQSITITSSLHNQLKEGCHQFRHNGPPSVIQDDRDESVRLQP